MPEFTQDRGLFPTPNWPDTVGPTNKSFRTDGGTVTTFPPQGPPGLDELPPQSAAPWPVTLESFKTSPSEAPAVDEPIPDGSLTVEEALSDLEIEEPSLGGDGHTITDGEKTSNFGSWSVAQAGDPAAVSDAAWSQTQSQLQSERQQRSPKPRQPRPRVRPVIAERHIDHEYQVAAERRVLLTKVVVVSAVIAASLSVLFTLI